MCSTQAPSLAGKRHFSPGKVDVYWREYWLPEPHSLETFELRKCSVELTTQVSFVSQEPFRNRKRWNEVCMFVVFDCV